MTGSATTLSAGRAQLPVRRSASRGPVQRWLARNRAPLVAALVFAALFGFVDWITPGALTYFDVAFQASGGTPLALAAMGQTLVVISGGFDLSAGAVISLVNAVLAANMDPAQMQASPLLWTLVGIGTGMAVGAFNGIFVAFLRLQPIVVTLSTMFIVQGLTLLILPQPGGFISPSLGSFYMGDAISGLVPASLVLLGLVALFWLWLKNTGFGVALYAVGSDPATATSTGVRTTLVRFGSYVIAGGFYGLAGTFVSAQTGSGDPLVGNSLLLQMFAAVVIGGTRLGGGKGGLVGTVFGAFVLMSVVNILLALNVSAYFSTIAEGAVLLAAVLVGSLSKDSVLSEQLAGLRGSLKARRAGTHVSQRPKTDRKLAFVDAHGRGRPAGDNVVAPGFFTRNGQTLRYALPAWIGLVLVLIATQVVLGSSLGSWSFWNSLLVLSTFLTILALGQGSVILTGGLDLSVPWTIGLSGILLAGIVQGSDAALLYAVPAVLGLAALIGLFNGLGVVALGLSPIVVTLAANGILQGAALLYSGGTPAGFASPLLRWMMTGHIGGVTPVLLFLAIVIVAGTLLLGRTAFGRRVYAVGNSLDAARLSGIQTGSVIVGVYVVSAICAALVGILLTGFSGQASLGMGDDYLLPSIAVVVVGGALITGGRGHFLGMVGGALLLTALQTLLAGTTLPYAFRAIFFGCVVLAAVLALRDKRN
ncbi:ABC transporter permease [Jiella sp. MQZ9-1]|uniref:ABC transporter permease n=1 Tax=Jiella flava TaxID=2816857 RepID=A0A939JX48_9HYPH|nr:ABC transporter permease [Jiella flava]MBO0664219.1 ABC transporter permease [Jiella flava]MCD2472865.1 ABC transporter permease [Jiella flava]